jgi:CrcB protein
MKSLPPYLAIGLGSALGGLARYGCDLLGDALWGAAFPWATIIVNVLGSFIVGLVAALTGRDGRVFMGALARQFVIVGICGGYTTFSAFSLQTVTLLSAGRIAAAAANTGLSLAASLTAVAIGYGIALKLNR